MCCRSRSTSGTNGKWWQVCRWNYVRTFYLPEHEPIPSNYRPSFESRMPSFPGDNVCQKCGVTLDLCDTCKLCDTHELKLITESGKLGTILPTLRKRLGVTQNGPGRAERGLPSMKSFLGNDDPGKRLDTDSEISDLEFSDLDLSDVEDILTDPEDSLYHVLDISDAEDWDADSVFDLGTAQLAHATENDFWEAVYKDGAPLDGEEFDEMEEIGMDEL